MHKDVDQNSTNGCVSDIRARRISEKKEELTSWQYLMAPKSSDSATCKKPTENNYGL